MGSGQEVTRIQDIVGNRIFKKDKNAGYDGTRLLHSLETTM